MASQARKVFGAFEKRAPGLIIGILRYSICTVLVINMRIDVAPRHIYRHVEQYLYRLQMMVMCQKISFIIITVIIVADFGMRLSVLCLKCPKSCTFAKRKELRQEKKEQMQAEFGKRGVWGNLFFFFRVQPSLSRIRFLPHLRTTKRNLIHSHFANQPTYRKITLQEACSSVWHQHQQTQGDQTGERQWVDHFCKVQGIQFSKLSGRHLRIKRIARFTQIHTTFKLLSQ